MADKEGWVLVPIGTKVYQKINGEWVQVGYTEQNIYFPTSMFEYGS